MRGERKEKFLTYLQVALLLCTWAVGFSWYSLWNDYVVTRPRSMDSRAGRVIPLTSHGVVVYLTEEERQKLALLNHVGYGIGLTFVSFSIWKQFVRRRQPLRESL
jgi:hypothetical protein